MATGDYSNLTMQQTVNQVFALLHNRFEKFRVGHAESPPLYCNNIVLLLQVFLSLCLFSLQPIFLPSPLSLCQVEKCSYDVALS